MPDPVDQTTQFVREAVQGQVASLTWVVEHFSPLLLSQARHRVGRGLAGLYEPEDLVNDVWLIALPRLADLVPRDGRLTPVLVHFLTRTLLLHYSTLLKKHFKGQPLGRGGAEDETLEGLTADVSGVITRTVRSESAGTLHRCIEALPERYREVLVQRGIEQNSTQEVAAALGIEPNTVAVRFKRAKEMLRNQLPDDVQRMMDDLD